ncbi:MAG: tetratricopeptide repeat protein [Myxococcales bacterium]|nr:tetratricopeptide repeat protein [Myxococcales bacterium]
MTQRAPSPILVVLLVLATVGAAEAQDVSTAGDVERARALFVEARAHLEAGRLEAADAALTTALELHDAPSIRWNLARVRAERGRLVEARELLRGAARGLAPSDPRRLEAAALEAELSARTPEVTFEVPAGLPGVELRLDGEVLNPAGYGVPRPVDPGAHRLEATAPSCEPHVVDLVLDEGERRAVTIPLRSAASLRVLRVDPLASLAPDVLPPPPGPLEAASEDGGGPTDEWWLWTLIGAAGASLIAGVAVAIAVETAPGAPVLPGAPIETSGGCE